jgi:hypothetical protein
MQLNRSREEEYSLISSPFKVIDEDVESAHFNDSSPMTPPKAHALSLNERHAHLRFTPSLALRGAPTDGFLPHPHSRSDFKNIIFITDKKISSLNG